MCVRFLSSPTMAAAAGAGAAKGAAAPAAAKPASAVQSAAYLALKEKNEALKKELAKLEVCTRARAHECLHLHVHAARSCRGRAYELM